MDTTFFYTILSGDTFASIATQINGCKGVTAADIKAASPSPGVALAGLVIAIPAKTVSASPLNYTVQPGDTFDDIAKNVNASAGVTASQIRAANPRDSINGLESGELIAIPRHTQKLDTTSSTTPAENIGYWDKTWHRVAAPANATMGLAFSGYSDPSKALAQSATVAANLAGVKYITIGGGNQDGSFSVPILDSINSAIQHGAFSHYQGIAYDVEEGSSGLSAAFRNSFSIAKAARLSVLVTVSHSAPFGVADAKTLMASFFSDANIDFLSPQLYTSGSETSNDWATSGGVTWDAYKDAKAAIVPSITHANLYENAQATFAHHQVKTAGYVVWDC